VYLSSNCTLTTGISSRHVLHPKQAINPTILKKLFRMTESYTKEFFLVFKILIHIIHIEIITQKIFFTESRTA